MNPLLERQIEPLEGAQHLRLLVNSVPKAGTHALLELARHIVGDGAWYSDRDVKSPDGDAGFLDEMDRRIDTHQSGFAIKGHVPWSPSLHAGLDRRGVRVLLIVRDLRDVACSTLRWMRDLSPDWPASRSLLVLPTGSARLMRILEGLTNEHPFDLDSGIDWSAPLPERFRRQIDWANALPAAAVIRYEDLLGAKGPVPQRETISRLLDHLRLCVDQETVGKLAASVYNPSAVTFHTGSAGGWEREFNADHRARFVELGGDEVNAALGYPSTAVT